MSALINVGIDLSGRKISAANLPAHTVFPVNYANRTVVIKTLSGNKIEEYKESNNNSILRVVYNNSEYDRLYTQISGTDTYKTVTLPADFGIVSEVAADSVSGPYITRTENEKVYAFTEDLNKVDLDKKLSGTALHPDVIYEGTKPNSDEFYITYTLSKSVANYSHIRIYTMTNTNEWGSVEVYQPNNKSVFLMGWNATNDVESAKAFFKITKVDIKNNKITTNDEKTGTYKIYPNIDFYGFNQVYIMRVEAWN